MIVDKIGKYKATADFTMRTSVSIGTIPKGTVIEITQIDRVHRKVIGPELKDWMRWDLPLELIGGDCPLTEPQ